MRRMRRINAVCCNSSLWPSAAVLYRPSSGTSRCLSQPRLTSPRPPSTSFLLHSDAIDDKCS
ncbi:hypothetical protein RR46_13287 [Papilio xuthus]|uniref:Uncharacterized protein n=1 Tax=Papilio xuthus TaxID=66420 RepID=A0A194PFC4_PAPXU|nr:hypothetical protein RR46_13287 [Papilio xuthus]